MFKKINVLIAGLLLLAYAPIQAADSYKLGVAEPSLWGKDSAKLSDPNTTIIHNLAKKLSAQLNRPVQIVSLPVNRLFKAYEDGSIDFTITPQFASNLELALTNTPLQFGFLVRKDLKESITLSNMKDKTVIAGRELLLMPIYKEMNSPQFITLSSVDNACQLLRRKRAHLFYYWVKLTQQRCQKKYGLKLDTLFQTKYYNISLLISPASKNLEYLKTHLTIATNNIRKSGTFDQAISKAY